MKYQAKTLKRRKPVEAMQYTLDNLNTIIGFVGAKNVQWMPRAEELRIVSLGEVTTVEKGSYVVKRHDGQLFVFEKHSFEKIYEKVKR